MQLRCDLADIEWSWVELAQSTLASETDTHSAVHGAAEVPAVVVVVVVVPVAGPAAVVVVYVYTPRLLLCREVF